jgi:hypothetical protein
MSTAEVDNIESIALTTASKAASGAPLATIGVRP